MKRIWSIVVCVMVCILFAFEPAEAGCVTATLCDAVGPGACSWTCNGGQPCKVSNTGWVTAECPPSCLCRQNGTGINIGSCSIDGSLCGGSGSDPYSGGGNTYGTCSCEPVETCPGASPVPYCQEVPYEPCCNLGEPLPSGSPIVSEWCGNEICNSAAGENQTTCPSDCGSPAAFCGDNSCNGGENCGSCPGDCGGACPPSDTCGNNICGTAESCTSCPGDCGSCLNCGNGSCSVDESCSTCAADCGACPDSCGDNQCTGLESCTSCPGDCGSCTVQGGDPWWQASKGHVYAGATTGTSIESAIFITYCISPDCIAQLITPDSTLLAESEGTAITGGGDIINNGFTNTANTEVIGSRPTRFLENYDFFYRNTDLGLNPIDDFAGQEGDIQKPTTTKQAHFHRGNVTLQTPWTVGAGEAYTVFIDGNLTITDPTNANQLTDVAEGGFLAFIVSGDILISETLGNETVTDTAANLEGIFITDGYLTIESRGPGVGDDRFVGEGSFISWTQVALDRDFDDSAGAEVNNEDTPIELFIFRPDLVRYTPEFLTRPHSIWQESN